MFTAGFQPLPAAVLIKTVTFIDPGPFRFKSQSQVLLGPSEPQTHGCKYLKYPLGLLQAFFFYSYINWMKLGCHLSFTRNTKELTLQLFFWVNCSALIMQSVVLLLTRAGVEQSTWDSLRIWENPLSTVAGESCDSAEEQNPPVRVINRDLSWKSKQWQRKGGWRLAWEVGIVATLFPEWLEDLFASIYCLVSCSLLSALFLFACAKKGHSGHCKQKI